MKYHLVNQQTGVTFCGVKLTPEKFGYDLAAFNAHYSKEHACSKCAKIAKTNTTL